MFSSAQFGHFLMAAAFAHKSYLLHDHEQHKKIQPEVKENRRKSGALVSWESFPAISYPQGYTAYLPVAGHRQPFGRNAPPSSNQSVLEAPEGVERPSRRVETE
jgi:hypothetical protein